MIYKFYFTQRKNKKNQPIDIFDLHISGDSYLGSRAVIYGGWIKKELEEALDKIGALEKNAL